MLGCRFSFKTYVKNVTEEVTKFSSKTTEVLLDTDGHVVTEFDIYQGAVAPNCFKSHANF